MLLLVLLFIAVPIAETYVIVQVAGAIGGWDTIGLLVAISIAGAFLVRHEGFIVLRRVQEQLDRGRMPGRELVDGALVLVGGVMMLVPGFLTDGTGLLLLFPPTRAVARSLLIRRFHNRVEVYGPRRGPGGPDDVIDI